MACGALGPAAMKKSTPPQARRWRLRARGQIAAASCRSALVEAQGSLVAEYAHPVMRVLVVVALVGCGDNVVPATPEPANGSRLKLQLLAYDDGTEQLAPGVYFDAERAETCRPLGW